MKINKVSQNTVSKQQYNNKTFNINGIDSIFLDKVTNNETYSYTWDVTTTSVEELDGLCTNELIWFSVDLFTISACVAIWDTGHVYVTVDICSDEVA